MMEKRVILSPTIDGGSEFIRLMWRNRTGKGCFCMAKMLVPALEVVRFENEDVIATSGWTFGRTLSYDSGTGTWNYRYGSFNQDYYRGSDNNLEKLVYDITGSAYNETNNNGSNISLNNGTTTNLYDAWYDTNNAYSSSGNHEYSQYTSGGYSWRTYQ